MHTSLCSNQLQGGIMTYRKVRTVVASSVLAALMVLGAAPAQASPRQDNDTATAAGGNGGDGGAAVAIGVCAIQIAVVGNAGCANNGVADASGGNGGDATAIADQN
ncbi:MAG: hypothetical protein ACRD0K_09300 [Egibacteraceae bacterium]